MGQPGGSEAKIQKLSTKETREVFFCALPSGGAGRVRGGSSGSTDKIQSRRWKWVSSLQGGKRKRPRLSKESGDFAEHLRGRRSPAMEQPRTIKRDGGVGPKGGGQNSSPTRPVRLGP